MFIFTQREHLLRQSHRPSISIVICPKENIFFQKTFPEGSPKNVFFGKGYNSDISCNASECAHFKFFGFISWGILVELVLFVLLGHPNSKIANSMKLVTFAFFSSQYHVFELKNIRGNLIAPNSNRWSLSNKNAMSQEDNRKIISLFGQEKSIFLHP